MKWSRRSFLRSLGLAGLATPLLTVGRAWAQAAAPRRVVIIFSPNGPQHKVGPTSGTERNFSFEDWWSPLSQIKNDGFFFRGCNQAGVPFGAINEYGHQSGTIGALTARTTEGTNTSTGPSLETFIGTELGRAGIITPIRSALWGLYDFTYGGAFWEAAGQGRIPMTNPYDILNQFMPSFGAAGGTTTTTTVAPFAQRRKHFILDRLAKESQRLRSRLDGAGRTMLDFHLDNIESLEASLAVTIQSGMTPRAQCVAPSGPISSLDANADFTRADNRDESLRAFTDLMALGFVCDITRVVGIAFGGGAERFAIPSSYNVPASGTVDSGDAGAQMHAWTHHGPDPQTMSVLKVYYNWFSQRVVDIVQKLKTTPDVDGRPLLDTTLVLWTSEFGSGDPHTNENIPVSMFGSSEGRFAPGRHFEASGSLEQRSLVLHGLFVSIIQHMGLTNIDSFGNAGRGPLDWLQG